MGTLGSTGIYIYIVYIYIFVHSHILYYTSLYVYLCLDLFVVKGLTVSSIRTRRWKKPSFDSKGFKGTPPEASIQMDSVDPL